MARKRQRGQDKPEHIKDRQLEPTTVFHHYALWVLSQGTHSNVIPVERVQRGHVLYFRVPQRSMDLFEYYKTHALSLPEIMDIVGQVLDGLIFLHSLGLVHRDIKLENVVVSGEGKIIVEIIDFDMSREIGTQMVDIGGTPGYVPPCRKLHCTCGKSLNACTCVKHVVNTYDDLWSSGIMLFCMVTGFLPWQKVYSALSGSFGDDDSFAFFRANGVFPLWKNQKGMWQKLHGTISAICCYVFNAYLRGTLTATSTWKVNEVLKNVSFIREEMDDDKCVSSLTLVEMCEFLRAHFGNMYQVQSMMHDIDRQHHRRVPGATRDLSWNFEKELEVLIEHNQNCAWMLHELMGLNTIEEVFKRLNDIQYQECCDNLPPILNLDCQWIEMA